MKQRDYGNVTLVNGSDLAVAFVIHGWNTDDVDSSLVSTMNA